MGKPTVIRELEAVRKELALKTKEKISLQVQLEVCEDDLRIALISYKTARELIRELETLLEGKEV